MERCVEMNADDITTQKRKYKCDICGDILKSDYILMNVMRCDKCLCKPRPRPVCDDYIIIKVVNLG